MGLFDVDLVQGDYAPSIDYGATVDYNPQYSEFTQRMFGDYTTDPAGVTDIDGRSNTSFWNFDQSQITSHIGDVINSVTQAGTKLGIQAASDAINENKNNSNPWVSSFMRNFSSTKTGAQIQAGSMATKFENFFYNPIVWMGAAALVLFMIFRR